MTVAGPASLVLVADRQDYPADEEGVDAEKPEEALGVATKLKEIGTK